MVTALKKRILEQYASAQQLDEAASKNSPMLSTINLPATKPVETVHNFHMLCKGLAKKLFESTRKSQVPQDVESRRCLGKSNGSRKLLQELFIARQQIRMSQLDGATQPETKATSMDVPSKFIY